MSLRITIVNENPAICEIYMPDLYKCIVENFENDVIDIERDKNGTATSKGIGKEIVIKTIASSVVSIFAKLIKTFTVKSRLILKIETQDGKKMIVDYKGDEIKEIEDFLMKALDNLNEK